MENDIALIATGYVLTRIGILAAFGYLAYRVLSHKPARVQNQSQSKYATERMLSGSFGR